MRDRQEIIGKARLMGGIFAAVAVAALSSCATTGGKTENASDAGKANQSATALADTLNAKAAAKQGYRDPLVRSVAGGQPPQTALDTPPPAQLPGSAASGRASIGSLVMQPTAVNASRSSIYSSPVPLDGAPPAAGPEAAYAPSQPAGSTFHSIYSTPAGTAAAPIIAPAPPPQQGTAPAPAGQSSQNLAAEPPVHQASATSANSVPETATASAGQGAAANSGNAGGKQAIGIARILASKGQKTPATGNPQANPDYALTPGMAASLKQPIAARPAEIDATVIFANALYGGKKPPLGNDALLQYASLPSMTHGATAGLERQNDQVQTACFKPALTAKLQGLEAHFGRPVIVTSGYRDPEHNHLVGGSEESLHTHCDAADIQVPGVSKWAIAGYLRSLPDRGGVGTYCHTESVHVDIGAPRDWDWGCDRI